MTEQQQREAIALVTEAVEQANRAGDQCAKVAKKLMKLLRELAI